MIKLKDILNENTFKLVNSKKVTWASDYGYEGSVKSYERSVVFDAGYYDVYYDVYYNDMGQVAIRAASEHGVDSWFYKKGGKKLANKIVNDMSKSYKVGDSWKEPHDIMKADKRPF